jgi:hypothetical protein
VQVIVLLVAFWQVHKQDRQTPQQAQQHHRLHQWGWGCWMVRSSRRVVLWGAAADVGCVRHGWGNVTSRKVLQYGCDRVWPVALVRAKAGSSSRRCIALL